MITQKNIELIDKYLKGELSEDKLKQFEQKMTDDTEFAKDVHFVQDTAVSVTNIGRREFKKKLQKITSDIERDEFHGTHTSSTLFSFNRKYTAIAASVALLITASIIFYNYNKNSQQNIAEKTSTADTLHQDILIQQKKIDIEQYLAESKIIFETKTIKMKIIKKESFGFVQDVANTIKLDLVFLSDKRYNNHYLLQDKLYLFGDFNESNIKLYLYEGLIWPNKHQTGDVIFLETEEVVYRLEITTSGALLPIVEETDSSIKQLIKSSVENIENKSVRVVPPPQTSKSHQNNGTAMTGLSETNNNSSQNSYRIIGSIVHIYDNFQLHDTSGVCAKAPCEATVKIETIKRRGASFIGAIAAGEKIKVHFAFTLNPTTKELFPNMTARYPGLKKNDKFVADIQSRLAIGGNENVRYVIYGYEKIE